MKHQTLKIRFDTIDGSSQTLIQADPELVNRTLNELHPTLIFTQDRIAFADEETEITLLPPLITRIDVMTDHWSVWDFPFALGAPIEITETEFMESLDTLRTWKRPNPQNEMPLFLDLQMVNGQRIFLCIHVVVGHPTVRLEKVYSLLKERRLIFGLRTGGVGILNLSNLVHFVVHPEPATPTAKGAARYGVDEPLTGGEVSHSIRSVRKNHVALDLERSK